MRRQLIPPRSMKIITVFCIIAILLGAATLALCLFRKTEVFEEPVNCGPEIEETYSVSGLTSVEYAAEIEEAHAQITERPLIQKETVPGEFSEVKTEQVLIQLRAEHGDYADVRLRYPHGEDYVVLQNKELIIAEEDGERNLYLQLSEKEIQYLSSAVYDAEVLSGSRLYLAEVSQKSGEDDNVSANYIPGRNILELLLENEMLTPEEYSDLSERRLRMEERFGSRQCGTSEGENHYINRGEDDAEGTDLAGVYWVYE